MPADHLLRAINYGSSISRRSRSAAWTAFYSLSGSYLRSIRNYFLLMSPGRRQHHDSAYVLERPDTTINSAPAPLFLRPSLQSEKT